MLCGLWGQRLCLEVLMTSSGHFKSKEKVIKPVISESFLCLSVSLSLCCLSNYLPLSLSILLFALSRFVGSMLVMLHREQQTLLSHASTRTSAHCSWPTVMLQWMSVRGRMGQGIPDLDMTWSKFVWSSLLLFVQWRGFISEMLVEP